MTDFDGRVFISPQELESLRQGARPQSEDGKATAAALTLKIIDARFKLGHEKWGRAEYRKEAIPQAVFLDCDSEMANLKPNGERPLPTVNQFAARCLNVEAIPPQGSKKQARKEAPPAGGKSRLVVVCYDESFGGLAAARAWWMLGQLGVETYILDGGLNHYKALGFRTAAGRSKQLKNTFSKSEQAKLLNAWPSDKYGLPALPSSFPDATSIDDVNLEKQVLIDSRDPTRFATEIRALGHGLAGHVPGAVCHGFTSNVVATEMTPKNSLPRSEHVVDPKRVLVSTHARSLAVFGDAVKHSLARGEPVVEISGLGKAIAAAADVSEMLKNSGFVTVKSIKTSGLDGPNKNTERISIEVVKSQTFDAQYAAQQKEREEKEKETAPVKIQTIKPQAELTTLLDKDRPSVFYCGSGVTACFNVAAMTHAAGANTAFISGDLRREDFTSEAKKRLGGDAIKVYVGSWTHYSDYKKKEILNKLLETQPVVVSAVRKSTQMSGGTKVETIGEVFKYGAPEAVGPAKEDPTAKKGEEENKKQRIRMKRPQTSIGKDISVSAPHDGIPDAVLAVAKDHLLSGEDINVTFKETDGTQTIYRLVA